jgi:hypothetical protein
MVAEAAAVQVPTLVRQVPSFADIPAELTVGERDVVAAAAVLDDPAAAEDNVSGWTEVLAGNTVADQRAALIAVYSLAGPRR